MNLFKQKYEDCNAHAATVLINSSCLQNSDMIDLHYFKVTEALKALDKFLDQHLNRLMCSGRSRMTVYIVTGRGTRSVKGISRIQPPVKNRLKQRQITLWVWRYNYLSRMNNLDNKNIMSSSLLLLFCLCSEIESHNTGLVKAVIRRNSLLSTDLWYQYNNLFICKLIFAEMIIFYHFFLRGSFRFLFFFFSYFIIRMSLDIIFIFYVFSSKFR